LSRPLLLSRFLLEGKVWGKTRAKTRANPASGRTHRQPIRVVRPHARQCYGTDEKSGERDGIRLDTADKLCQCVSNPADEVAQIIFK